MKIEISYSQYERLKELLEILEETKKVHDLPNGLSPTLTLRDDTMVIDPWNPSGWKDRDFRLVYVNYPGFTVGTLRMASQLKADLKL